MRVITPSLLGLSLVTLFLLSACDSTSVQEDPLRTNLHAPTLLQPQIKQTLPSSITFEWTSVEGAARYEFELETATADPSLMPTVAPFHLLTLEAGTYSWRVRALDVRGRAGYWSKRRSLSVVYPSVVQP